jgi:hypothetical protein
MDLPAIARRIKRLESLVPGLSKGQARNARATTRWSTWNARPNLQAVQDIIAGLETARVVLAMARQRLTRG